MNACINTMTMSATWTLISGYFISAKHPPPVMKKGAATPFARWATAVFRWVATVHHSKQPAWYFAFVYRGATETRGHAAI